MRRLIYLRFVFVAAMMLAVIPAYGQEKAKFRITVCGWKCMQETTDHALQVDGKGDEVWVTARVQPPDKDTPLVVRTKTMGDVNDKQGRVQAGSRSDKGGIKTGDQFPAQPFAASNPLPPNGLTENSRPDLPFVLWEGELAQGGSSVEVSLSIWEDDEGGAPAWDQVLKALNSPIAKDQLKSVPVYNSGDGGTKVNVDLSGIGGLLPQIFGRAADRPIGLPKAKTFTYDEASKIAKTSVSGLPEGVLPIPFNDSEDPNIHNQGQYIVWLRISEVK